MAPAIAFGLTAAVVLLARINHPPALSTALIVSTGPFTEWPHAPLIVCAAALLTIAAVSINRVACLPLPLWRPRRLDANGPL